MMRRFFIAFLIFTGDAAFSQSIEEVTLNNQAVALMDSGDYSEALVFLNKLVQSNPTNTIYQYNRAVTLFNLKKYREALSAYKTLSTSLPEEGEYLFQIGNAYEQLDSTMQAVKFYSKAIETDKDQFLYYFKRGTIFLKQNKWKDAETDFNSSLLLNPTHHNSLHNRGIALFKLGQQSKACEDWCQSFQLGNEYSGSHLNQNCKKFHPCVAVK